MAKKSNRLPYQVKEQQMKGWRVIIVNKEIILIAKKEKRRLWDVSLQKFVCDWNSFFDSPVRENQEILEAQPANLCPVEA
ncbi:MAG: hypothetical protein WC164_03395 [Patescibacteria group bacterium]